MAHTAVSQAFRSKCIAEHRCDQQGMAVAHTVAAFIRVHGRNPTQKEKDKIISASVHVAEQIKAEKATA